MADHVSHQNMELTPMAPISYPYSTNTRKPRCADSARRSNT